MQLLFDIGGTRTRLAAGREDGSVGEPIIFDTPMDFKEGLECIIEKAKTLAEGNTYTGAAGGIAGPLDSTKTMMITSPNLPRWAGKPFTRLLQEELGCPIYLENDAALVGLGEIHYGKGNANYPIMAYVTISTGIGGCRFVEGKIDRSARGFEIGHHIIDLAHQKTFEELASGSGILKRFGKPAENIDAASIWEEVAEIVAIGIHNLILFWSPHAVIIGGGMATDSRFPFENCVTEIQRRMRIFPDIPPIIKAELGNLGGLYGAKVLLDQKEPAPL